MYDFGGTTEPIKGIRSIENDANLSKSRPFCIVAGTNPTVIYTRQRERVETEVMRLLDRQDAGADIVQTQPVFDTRFFEFLDVVREHGLKLPILVGILPLRSKTDSFEIEERYGITIQTELKTALQGDGENAGNKLARKLALDLVGNGVRTLHIYPRENCKFLLDLASCAFGSGPLDQT